MVLHACSVPSPMQSGIFHQGQCCFLSSVYIICMRFWKDFQRAVSPTTVVTPPGHQSSKTHWYNDSTVSGVQFLQGWKLLQAQALPGHCLGYFESCVLISRGPDTKMWSPAYSICVHRHICSIQPLLSKALLSQLKVVDAPNLALLHERKTKCIYASNLLALFPKIHRFSLTCQNLKICALQGFDLYIFHQYEPLIDYLET